METDEGFDWEKMPRPRLIEINKGLVEMGAQQSRIIADLRKQRDQWEEQCNLAALDCDRLEVFARLVEPFVSHWSAHSKDEKMQKLYSACANIRHLIYRNQRHTPDCPSCGRDGQRECDCPKCDPPDTEVFEG
jgi:hypothetical protein